MKVVVVGSGVIGLCSAWYLSERGHQVTVLERRGPDYEGCSYGNAGYLTPSHFVPLAAPGVVRMALKWMLDPESPFYVKPRLDWDLISWGWLFNRAATKERVEIAAPVLRDLGAATLVEYRKLAEEWDNEFLFVQRGILTVCQTEHHLAGEVRTAEAGRRIGVAADVLDAKGIAELEPGVRIEALGGVLYPGDATIAPGLFLRALIRRLSQKGVEVKWNTEVTGWRTGNGRIEAVRTSKGEVQGDEYVVCGGSWSPAVVRDLDIKLPMQAGKGYSLTLPNPPARINRGIILAEGRVAVTPIGDAMRFGGTMEISGTNEGITPARIRGIVKSSCRYFKDYKPSDFDGIQPWSGLRPCSADGLPYLGRFRKFANLSAATGHAMLGLSLGPITGKLVAQHLSGEPTQIPLQMLAPDRYA